MHCISVQLWPTCMRCARATREPYAGKLFVAIFKDTAQLSVEPRPEASVSGLVDFFSSRVEHSTSRFEALKIVFLPSLTQFPKRGML